MILFSDTTTGNLLSGINLANPVSSFSLPFFSYVAALPMQIYLMEQLPDYTPSQPSYEIITSNLSPGGLIVQIDDGININNPYTQQVNWVADPVMGQFWTASLAMNTNTGGGSGVGTGIVGLVNAALAAGKGSATAWLRIASYVGGQLGGTQTANQINIQPGIPGAVQALPAGLTPLSLQQAIAMFPQWANNPAGRGIVLTSPTGHTIEVSAQDNGDGTARIDETEIS